MSYIRYVENFRIPMTGISRMLKFITELRDNNNREWFAAVKPEYEKIRNECYDEIDKLIALISPFDENLIGVEAKDCVYRIYRDIRFSADKSPFKTHFGIVLGKGGRKCWDAAYYLHIEPGECALYGGVWFPEQPVLTRLRHDKIQRADRRLFEINAKRIPQRLSIWRHYQNEGIFSYGALS